MATVTEDLSSAHELNEVLGGFEIARIFRVSGLVAAPKLQLLEAATTPGVPIIDEIYDVAWTVLRCVTRDFTPDGPNAARAVCVFSTRKNASTFNQPEPTVNDGQDVKQISAGVRTVKTAFDRGGSAMTLSAPASRQGWKDYASEADVVVPVGQIVFERVETTPAVARARGLVGHVNSDILDAYAVNTLLFRDLQATSEDGGYRWNCTYTFDYDFLKHVHQDQYHGPDGKVPDDATAVTWDVLPEASFSSLGLDFSDSQTPVGPL